MDAAIPLSEYPRPQLRRDSYLCLNGQWEYAIKPKSGQPPAKYDGMITVPYSPECKLSGVERVLLPSQHLWYRRTFTLPEGFNKGRVLLHFGAVDQQAVVYVNDARAVRHEGGYTPFSADITKLLKEGENVLAVRVRDRSDRTYISHGKQKLHSGGMWYTPQSGIWQTVWLESVPESYIFSIRMTPVPDESVLKLTVFTADDGNCTLELEGRTHELPTNRPNAVKIEKPHLWSPDDPYLTPIKIRYGDDEVESYFGLRKLSIEPDEDGHKRLCLNGKPLFRTGLLDQGYYPDGMYTPRDDTTMIHDIMTAKTLGFNMLRKHVKIEPLRWYYHCDRLGMLVWQDMVNGGRGYRPTVIQLPLLTDRSTSDSQYHRFGRGDEEGRKQFIVELDEMIDTLYNCVCIELWSIFNEGWGQFDAEKLTEHVRMKDRRRFIDHASGWHDQGAGDILSRHVYFKPYTHEEDELGRACTLTEFGGYTLRADGHTFSERTFGYKKFADSSELSAAIKRLYEDEIIPAKSEGLCACVYTQLADVEDELNGLLTYDREVLKTEAETMRRLNAQLIGDQPPADRK